MAKDKEVIEAEIVSNDPDWKPTAKLLRGRDRVQHNRGPKGLINDRLVVAICNLAEKGLHKSEIAPLVGIGYGTLRDWLDPRKRQGEKYDRFREAFAEAEAKDIEARVDRIGDAAKADPRNWKADAWYLERRYPKKFGEKKQITHTAQQQGLTQEQFEQLTPQQQDEYDHMLERMEQFLMLGTGDETGEE